MVVALNPRYRTHELAYILAQPDSTAVLLTDHLGPVDYRPDMTGECLEGFLDRVASAGARADASAARPGRRCAHGNPGVMVARTLDGRREA